MELSPTRLTVCPVSAASTQLPPSCLKHPFKEAGCLDWSPVRVSPRGTGLCCSLGEGSCIHTMPAVSDNANNHAVFILLLHPFLMRFSPLLPPCPVLPAEEHCLQLVSAHGANQLSRGNVDHEDDSYPDLHRPEPRLSKTLDRFMVARRQAKALEQ